MEVHTAKTPKSGYVASFEGNNPLILIRAKCSVVFSCLQKTYGAFTTKPDLMQFVQTDIFFTAPL